MLSIIILLCFNSLSTSESYEGWIERFPVWFDLTVPQNDGPVQGNYFYKKVGSAITVKGEKKGGKITLTEYGKKGTPTGYIVLSLSGNSLVGRWGKKDGDSLYNVTTTKTDSSYRSCAKNQAQCDKMVRDEMKKFSDPSEGYDEPPILTYHYSHKNIFCADFSWSFMGAYPNFGVEYSIYDLATTNEISVWDEIDSSARKSFYQYMAPQVEGFLSDLRASQDDSVWRDNFSTFFVDGPVNDTARALDSIFSAPATLDGIQEKLEICYIDSQYVHFTNPGHGYLEFPHVNEALDGTIDITISFEEFDKYLKRSSPLRSLAQKR